MEKTVEKVVNYRLSASEIREAILKYVENTETECGLAACPSSDADIKWEFDEIAGWPRRLTVASTFKKGD